MLMQLIIRDPLEPGRSMLHSDVGYIEVHHLRAKGSSTPHHLDT